LGEVAYDRNADASGFHRQIAAVLASGSRLRALRTLQVPTLVIHGEEDPLIRIDGGRATADAISDARFVTFPGMAHDLPEELWPDFVRHISELTGSN
jgi:pimeloyl-ACP methyl ester carboxylesterase